MVPFGPWLPDHPSLGHPGVLELENAFPASRGFRAVRGPTQITEPALLVSTTPEGVTPISDANMPRIRGIFSTVSVNSGTLETNVFVGTAGALYKVDGTTNKFSPWNYSATTPPASVDPSYSNVVRWNFAEFATTTGPRKVYAAGGAQQALQVFDSNGSTAPSDVTNGPNAVHLCVVGRFLVCGNTSVSEGQVRWSQIDDAESWVQGSNQAGSQILPDASEITGMVGGETGLILTRDGLYRQTYVGAPLVMTFDKVSNRGCDFAGSIASLSSDDVFFLSEDGFQRYRAGQVENIGAEAVNEFFFTDFDRNFSAELGCVIDPANDLVIWSYGAFGGNTTNNRLLAYNYVLGTWGVATIAHDAIGIARQLGKTLEQLDTGAAVTYSGQLSSLNSQIGGPSNVSIDEMSTSLDSARFAGGPAIVTLAVSANNGPYSLTESSSLTSLDGDTLPLTLTTGEFEPAEKQHVMIRSVMPHIEATDTNATVSCAVGGRTRQIDPLTFNDPAQVNDSNIIPARRSSRYFALRFTATGDWSQAFGFSYDGTAQGRR